jgi:NTE family protein
MINGVAPSRPASYDKKVALVLQGGGALGSYQAGVYEALASSEYLPDWVAGISIGAVNSALIAGNASENRVAQLRRFWEGVTSRGHLWAVTLNGPFSGGQRQLHSLGALVFGQPGFLAPRPLLDWISYPNPVSYYDTSSLKSTLERLIDFDRINAREMRFSVGAVNVRTGTFAYFDNDKITIRPEHVMASAALAARLSAGRNRWRAILGRRTRFQHATAIRT